MGNIQNRRTNSTPDIAYTKKSEDLGGDLETYYRQAYSGCTPKSFLINLDKLCSMKNRTEGVIISNPGIISRFQIKYVDNKPQFLNNNIKFERCQLVNLSNDIIALGIVYVKMMNCYVFADEVSTGLFAIFNNGKIKQISDGYLFN